MTNNFDPFDVREALKQTTVDALELDDVFQRAVKLAEDVQALHAFVSEVPRWASLWDQCQRASSSVALNFAQGCGKLRGFTSNDWLCARAELMETYAALCIGPERFRELKADAKALLALLDSRIAALPQKHERPSWRD
jgi:four helix bundle protein